MEKLNIKINSHKQTESGNKVNGFQSKKTFKIREHDLHRIKRAMLPLKKERRTSKEMVMVPMEAEDGFKNLATMATTNSGWLSFFDERKSINNF